MKQVGVTYSVTEVLIYWCMSAFVGVRCTETLCFHNQAALPNVLPNCSPADQNSMYCYITACCTIDRSLLQVSRFLQLVTTSRVALTGLNFFSVTRPMLLTVRSKKWRYLHTHAEKKI
jgi:hypothetical protein